MTDLWNPDPEQTQAEAIANLRREQARREVEAMREKLNTTQTEKRLSAEREASDG